MITKEKANWSFERSEIKAAIIISVLGFAWLLGEYAVGLHDKYVDYHPIISMFGIVIPIVGIRIAIGNKKKSNGGNMTYAEGFKTGSFVSVLSGVMAPIGLLIYTRIINPNWFDFMVKYSTRRALQAGLKGEQLTQSITYAQNYFNERSYVLQTCFGTIVSGIVISAIISLMMRTKGKQ